MVLPPCYLILTKISQFLPQDKVASFAQLSATDLLKETQRAVGGAEMVNHWQNLCNKRKEERDLQAVIPLPPPSPLTTLIKIDHCE